VCPSRSEWNNAVAASDRWTISDARNRWGDARGDVASVIAWGDEVFYTAADAQGHATPDLSPPKGRPVCAR